MPTIETPIGTLYYVMSASGALTELGFGQGGGSELSIELERQIADFFAGKRTDFDIPLEPKGTEFQKRVWNQLLKIPFGETRTYQQIANALGQPTATRAVGMANGANPIALIIPCHRVIGADGRLTGYGGGLEMKARLLEFECGSLFSL